VIEVSKESKVNSIYSS